jgi:hypothetical protein
MSVADLCAILVALCAFAALMIKVVDTARRE